ncbi:uncharacterized protein MYCFIDRAFT_214757 [Pseudocercospora fijiensis CIRAD86]|uniref:SEC7 domain-containing protein n=1 Tax=Pseudocercospora fijiensis (strain CIRAD86) TaxID=383855 RepID=M3B537_PSEFD|nr:uncharacterized protein MYCFIDRAFT_214757 [Pseudocercospora fijiensis CIRAD86]EME84483.1 hypothetical protein MYCFIDRAFT_214757 [Pseudocercospora fijiensis CIRAD86]
MPLLGRRRSLLDFRHGQSQSQSQNQSQRQRQRQHETQNSDHSAHINNNNNDDAAGSASLGTSSARSNARNTLLPIAPPSTPPRPASQCNPSHSRLSHELHPDDIDASTDNEGTGRLNERFSLMRFRNFSESHLSVRARMDAERERVDEDMPPVPVPTSADAAGTVPTILKTAPTMDHAEHAGQQHAGEERRPARSSLFKRASARGRSSQQLDSRKSMDEVRQQKKSLRWGRARSGLESLHRLSTMHLNNQHMAPPSYGDESNSALAVPVSMPDPRMSESSRSDGSNASSGDGHIYASTTTTTHTVSTHTTFFKLPRRNKNRNSLFPLPIKLPHPDDAQSHADQGPTTPRASTHSTVERPSTTPTERLPEATQLRRAQTEASPTKRRSQSALSSPHASLAKASLSFAEPGMNLFRHSSSRSINSVTSSPLQPPMRLGLRDRSSTTSSFGAHSSHDAGTPPPLSASARNSTSTTGRSSFGGFLNLSRFRQSSEPHSPRHGSPGTGSKSNSFAMSREALVVPDREYGDTPGKYLERLQAAVAKSVIAGILSKSSDPFMQAVLRSYTRTFPFFTEPIDMSLRKFLLQAELPKETQQVDRVIQAFADRYHECNPGIFLDSGVAYVVAFSIMMLHTDAFNKNNKRKMQKPDYLKNTSGQGISDDVLACFYDNIVYTPFVHWDEDVDFNGERMMPFKSKKNHHAKLRSAIPGSETTKKPSGPVDPYTLIIENRLDTLRPNIKDSILMDDPYDYRGNQGELDPGYLQRAFTHTGMIQIISPRSRPAAYESQMINGQPNPTETQQGIIDLKITKVGLLWRKSSKKKKTRSPWQEWGAILTASQLYLFKNSHWAKGLMQQFHNAQRPMQARTPVTFKPPLQDFKPDALIKTDNAIALVDSTYNRHKNAFTFVGTSGQDEVFLADNEAELNDWLGLINYAAAFRAAGVRIRGMVGGSEEDNRPNDVSRLDSTKSTHSIQTQMGEATIRSRTLEPSLQKQVMAARRQIMVAKINELEKGIVDANRQLESMLRNARHLLVLAPIAPKTREDVVHAAAKADAMIKWALRDIWRMKAHRDILAMDVRIDGLSASDLEKLTMSVPTEPESAKKHKPTMLTRLSSSRTPNARSPPQSPLTLQMSGRPPTRGSVDRSAGIDVFSTPPESASPAREDGWRLPPLNIDASAEPEPHRPSIASTYLSASPPASYASLSHSASMSSMLQMQRTASTSASETTTGRGKTTPAGSINERELQLLARATVAPDAEGGGRGPSFDGTASGNSPESKHKGVRRSLQKTLRDHHQHSHSHRHRRNKNSDSTVRSGGFEDRETEEATPGLTREKPRFILHGKQASVVQFGGDWERIKLRREQYGSQHSASPYEVQLDAAVERRRSEQHELLRAGLASPVVHDFGRDTADEDTDAMSVLSEGSRGFREDAQVAAAYTTRKSPSDSPRHVSSSEEVSDIISGVFDLSSWDPDAGCRTTVIGPATKATPSSPFERHRRYSSLQKSPDGNIEHIEENDDANSPMYSTPPSFTDRENRRTVIGPPMSSSPLTVRMSPESTSSSQQALGRHGSVRKIASAEASTSLGRRLFPSTGSTSAGAAAHETLDAEGENDSEGEKGFVAPISDEELRRMSSSLSAPASPQRMRVM